MTSIPLGPVSAEGPKAPSRRTIVVSGALLAVAGVAAVAKPRRYRPDPAGVTPLGSLIPAQIGTWTQQPDSALVVPDETNAGSEHEQTLTRVYAEPNAPPLMMLISNHVARTEKFNLHRPEWCYQAAGFRLEDFRKFALDVGAAKPVAGRIFTAIREDRVEQVLYWMRVEDDFPTNAHEQGWVIFRNGLSGFNVDGALVRLSVISRDLHAGQAMLESFATAMVRTSGPSGRKLLVGRLTPTALGQRAVQSAR